jgi:hypothetical protein
MTEKPLVIIVGADKGGVGKTMVSRALLDFLKSQGIENRAFDTEVPAGVLARFFGDRTAVVDLTESDGQMQVFDTLGQSVTVIDIRAGLLSPTLKTLAEIGFLDPAKCRIVVLHILGNSQASRDEVKAITGAIAGARYVGVANHVGKTKFDFPPGALDIPALDVVACEDVDAAGVSFVAYANGSASPVLRGKVRYWLGLVFAQFEKAGLIDG